MKKNYYWFILDYLFSLNQILFCYQYRLDVWSKVICGDAIAGKLGFSISERTKLIKIIKLLVLVTQSDKLENKCKMTCKNGSI